MIRKSYIFERMGKDTETSASAGGDALTAAGLAVRGDDAHHLVIEVTNGDWRRYRVIERRAQNPSPSELTRDVRALENDRSDGVLYVVRSASASLRNAAQRDGRVNFVSADDGSLTLATTARSIGPVNKAEMPKRGRVPWGRYAVLRILILAREPLTQQELGRRAGVTQAAASQALGHFGDRVAKRLGGWEARHRGELIGQFLSGYPGPRGISTYWAGFRETRDQALFVRDVVSGNRSVECRISGDVAADEYAPWRRPTRALLYCTRAVDLVAAELVPASRHESTLELRVPADQTVWTTAAHWASASNGAGSALLDPLMALWDLAQNTGSDVPESVARFVEKIEREAVGPRW